jgi:hypothetical protein
LPDGRCALASISLRRFPKGRRVYAYLRFKDGSRTVTRYVGQVHESLRADALAAAWKAAREKGFVD